MIPRDRNKEAERLIKQVDYVDWFTKKDLVNIFSVFNICPNSEVVDAFSNDCLNEINLLDSHVYLISKTIKYFMSLKHSVKVILVCQYWPSSTSWPLLFKSEGEFHNFINNVVVIDDVAR